MSRKMYETPADLENERRIALHTEKACNFKLNKMGIKYHLDFMAFRGKEAVAAVEVKHRNKKSTDWPTTILPLHKYNRGVEFHNFNGLSFLVVFEFDDGIYCYKYKDGDNFSILFGGRKDRGDVQDLEPFVCIPIERMQKL